MLRSLAAVLLFGVMLSGTSQAFTINLMGTMDLLPGVVGDPPGFLGAGTYAYTASIQAEPANTLGVNPTLVTSAVLDLSAAGLAPFMFPTGTVIVSGAGGADTVTADLLGGINGTTVTFVFANATDPISTDIPDNDNVRILITTLGPSTITTTGELFPSPGPPAVSIIGSATSTAVVLAPEPSSFALLAVLSVGGAGIYRIRRKRAVAA